MKTILAISFCLLFSISYAQDEEGSLLDLIDEDSTVASEYITNAFKSTRVINGQSIEMLGAGALDFRILHRFGLIKKGIDEIFGLDQSTMRFSFDYAPLNDLLIGFGRSSSKKELDGYVKYRLLHQSKGERVMPVSVVLISGITCETLPFADQSRPNYFSSRLAFFNEVLVGSKLSDDISLQVSPLFIHRNLVDKESTPNDIYALGFGGRVKLTNRIAFMLEYHHAFNGMTKGINKDALSLGFDIETGGHVFQLHVSNATGMNERAFVTETTNDWMKGEIQFGFNLSRMFQL